MERLEDLLSRAGLLALAGMFASAAAVASGERGEARLAAAHDAGRFLGDTAGYWQNLEERTPFVSWRGHEGFVLLQRLRLCAEGEEDMPAVRSYLHRVRGAAGVLERYEHGTFPDVAALCRELSDRCLGLYERTPDPGLANDG